MSIRTLLRIRTGQTTAEYGVVLGVIALAVAIVMTLLAGTIEQVLSSV